MLCTPCLALVLLAALPQESSLDAALDRIQSEKVESDVNFLASETLGGRGTPGPGLEVAALYLRARLERLGFEPGGPQGYWHEYPLELQRIDAEASHIVVHAGDETLELTFGDDYYLRSTDLDPLDLRGEVISVGDGDEADFEGLEVRGRWALLNDQGRSTRRAIDRCEEAGCIGVLVAPGSRYAKRPYAERYAPTTRAITEGRVTRAALKEAQPRARIARVSLDPDARDRLFALGRPFDGDDPPAGHLLGLELEETRRPGGGEVLMKNVCGFLRGSNPELADEVILVTAHYDHLGMRDGTIFFGADDNASGTSGLLAVAEALAAHGPLERSVLCLWVSAEEKGLWGSDAWARDAWLPDGARPVCDINLDMIGRTGPDELYVTPSRDHEQFNPVAEAAYRLAAEEGFAELESQDEYWRSSDHFSFQRHLEIPVVFLSSGDHPDYHKSTDTADKIDCDKVARTARLVLRMLDRLQAEPLTDDAR